MPRLIINADDFGLTSGVNRAIEEANRAGVVTSATLMAKSQAFEEAVALAKKLPRLEVGCHVVLIDGEPIGSGLTSLTDGTARFKSSLKDFALAAVRKQLSQDEIQREAEAQIRKIQSAGIQVTHVDTHKHTHIFPHVLLPVMKAAKACGIRAIRNPFEPFRVWASTAVLSRPAMWIRAFEVTLLLKFERAFGRIVREEGISTTDGSLGVIATGGLDQKVLLSTIEAIPQGTWELVCHPGYADTDLRGVGTRLLGSRQVELEVLRSEQTKQALEKRGIRLISYADLALGS